MRSSLPIPALAFLALALAGCEVQPVVSNITPPPAVQTEITVANTTTAETSSETGDGAGVPEIVSEAEPETASREPGAVAATATEQDEPVAEITVAKASSKAGDGAGVPKIVSEAEPETASQEPDAVADTEAEQDDPAEETAGSSQTDPAEPETAPAIPATAAKGTGEVAGVVQTGAGEQTEERLPQKGDLAMAAPRPPPPPPPPELAPSSLIGISIPMLQSRLGQADFTRTEGGVETWQYRFKTCVVDYFLVVDSDATKIVSWAWRAPVISEQIDETACRRALAGRDAAS